MKYTAGGFQLILSEQTAQLQSLSFHGTELVGAKLNKPLFSLVVLNAQNDRITLLPQNGVAEADGIHFVCTTDAQDVSVQAVLRVQEQKDALHYSLEVCNTASDCRVVETIFDIQGLSLPDAELLYPHHAGEKIKDPAQTLRSEKYQKFWRAYSRLVDGEWLRECNYCGLCSMSWMYLQN